MNAVRLAAPADVPALARVFARAYEADPLMKWFVPEGTQRIRRLERFFDAGLERMIRHRLREVYTTEDVVGAAAWAAPGSCRLPVTKMIPGVPAIIRSVGVTGMRRSARAYSFLQGRHPREPHWFLESIATDPDAQGKGAATSLMRPILAICDRRGLIAYLETQNPTNVPFYERRGFVVTDEVDIAAGGPHMWLMQRRPGGDT